MWIGKTSIANFKQKSCWKVDFFCEEEANILSSAFQLMPLGEIVKERKEKTDPQANPDKLINYIGLENIQSLTGDLVKFSPKYGREIRSTSKVFHEGDILYGRLRPYLNKVYLAEKPISDGICSGEFYVLNPNLEIVLPNFLRTLLASEYVQKYARKWQTGSALPRLRLQDLLGIEIPLPPVEIQQEYESFLIQKKVFRRKLAAQLSELPQKVMETVIQSLEYGEKPLDFSR